MKKIITPLLVSSLLLLPVANAAVISWGAANDIAGDSDVSTTGSLVFSTAFDTALGATVNGVTFASGGDNTTIRNSSAYGTDLSYTLVTARNNDGAFTATGGTFETLSTEYQNLLNGAVFDNQSGASNTVTLGNLTIGQDYELQIWHNDPRTFGAGRSTAFGTTTLNSRSPDVTGNAGQYVIATFTADAATQDFVAAAAGAGWTINALQLRAVPEPTSSALLLGGIGMLMLRRSCRA